MHALSLSLTVPKGHVVYAEQVKSEADNDEVLLLRSFDWRGAMTGLLPRLESLIQNRLSL